MWVVSFYKFCALNDIDERRAAIETACRQHPIKGTVLLAPEGFNVALAGERKALEGVVAAYFANVEVNWSRATASFPSPENVFRRLKVLVKDEIVTFGQTLDGKTPVGEHVGAETWNELLADRQVVVVDARNRYESALGKFRGAICANTDTFGEFPAFVANELDPERHPRVALYCTGGIRCEKASAHLLQRGFKRVYQLEGGILRYLAQTNAARTQFEGDCFVFDDRGSVGAEDVESMVDGPQAAHSDNSKCAA